MYSPTKALKGTPLERSLPPVSAIIGSTTPPPAVLIVFIYTNGANECHDNLYCAEP